MHSHLFARRRVLHAAAPVLGLLLVACGADPPTSSPPATPTPEPTPAPTITAPPSPTVSPSPTPGGAIDHPTGASDLVLRKETGGGLRPMGSFQAEAPEFSLYGDGTFIVRPIEDPDRPDIDQGLPRFVQGRLEEASLQTLLDFALTSGRLADAREDYPQNTCADCPLTLFTMDAGGLQKVIRIDGLGIADVPADALDRAGFQQLAELLDSFEARARAGDLGDIQLYEATHYRLTLMEAFGEPTAEPLDWPWTDLTPDDFEPGTEFGLPHAILARDQVALITELPSGGHLGIPVTHDDTLWLVGVRPLLPDEVPAG